MTHSCQSKVCDISLDGASVLYIFSLILNLSEMFLNAVPDLEKGERENPLFANSVVVSRQANNTCS